MEEHGIAESGDGPAERTDAEHEEDEKAGAQDVLRHEPAAEQLVGAHGEKARHDHSVGNPADLNQIEELTGPQEAHGASWIVEETLGRVQQKVMHWPATDGEGGEREVANAGEEGERRHALCKEGVPLSRERCDGVGGDGLRPGAREQWLGHC